LNQESDSVVYELSWAPELVLLKNLNVLSLSTSSFLSETDL